MKIFITGGTGFIGNKIIDALLEKGHEIVCLCHSRQPSQSAVKVVSGNILDKNSLHQMKGCDALIANAAIYELGPPKNLRKTLYEVNVQGTKNTLDVALELGIPKIIYTSSVIVLGNMSHLKKKTVDENNFHDHTGKFHSVYERAKFTAHQYAEMLIREKNAPITIAMPTSVFGENDHANIGNTCRDLAKGKFKGIIKSPNLFNYIHVEDVANGIVLCLEKGVPGSYLLGGPDTNNVTFEELCNKLADLGELDLPNKHFSLKMALRLGKLYDLKTIFTRKQQEINSEVFKILQIHCPVSINKAESELGYHPQPFDLRLKQTINWYKNQFLS